jgi:hypothetical protein
MPQSSNPRVTPAFAKGRPSRRRSSKATVETYRDDPLYQRIVSAVDAILASSKIVAPVDVLVRMDLLSSEDLEE